jgi:hypothetical protein
VNATDRIRPHPLTLLIPALVLSACGSTTEPSTPPPSTPSPATPSTAQPSASPAAIESGASIEPAGFVSTIDNPWFPLLPGSTWTYRGVKDGEPGQDTMTVTTKTKDIAGIPAVVVHDELVQGGKVRERTDDYYAQDTSGNVWYLGEETAELDDAGKITSTEGTWLTAVDGAAPGIIMPADPEVGVGGSQEIYPGHAEDHYVVLLTDAKIKVPAGSYTGAVVTAEWTPLEPDVLSEKVYVKGVGEVREADVKGGDEKFELVRTTTP